jgi:hypothetical protein
MGDGFNQSSSSLDNLTLLEAIVCSVIVDGLSRTGSYRVFDTSGPKSQWPIANYNLLPDFEKRILRNELALEIPPVGHGSLTKIEASMKISGFSFQRSLATYLSMAVLLAHLLMATANIIYVVYKRRTSNSWGTIAELIALSQNSQQALDVLPNTSGGINSRKTFLQMAKIRVRRVHDVPSRDHVEMIFEDPKYPDHQLDASNHEQEELHGEESRHPRTWPMNTMESTANFDVESWRILGFTDGLLQQPSIDSREATDLVQLDQDYE